MRCVPSVSKKIMFAKWVIFGYGFDELGEMADGNSEVGGQFRELREL